MTSTEELSTRPTSPKLFVFVLMPFLEEFDDVYQLAIKAACKSAGAYCERVDEQIFQGSILERIYNQIAKADLVIADMTGRNPNVFYEVGYAHALNKNVVLLTQNAGDIPFDLRHYQHIVYNKLHALESELVKRVQWYVEHAGSLNPAAPEMLRLYVDGKPFELPQVLRVRNTRSSGVSIFVSFSLHNSTSQTLLGSKHRLAIVTDHKFDHLFSGGDYGADAIPQPDGRFMYLLARISDMFPGSWYAIGFYLTAEEGAPATIKATLRVFTEVGIKDHDIVLETVARDMANPAAPADQKASLPGR